MQSLAALHPDRFLSGVLDDVGVALVVVDGQDCSTLTNQAARQILGHPERLDGISLEEWRRDYVFRDDQGRPIPTELAPIVRARAGEQVPPQDIDVTLPDGRAAATGVELVNGEGKRATSFVCITVADTRDA